jgi:hypothetical protein
MKLTKEIRRECHRTLGLILAVDEVVSGFAILMRPNFNS